MIKYWTFIPYSNKARISTLIISNQHDTGGASQGNKQENEIVVINIEEEEIKLSLFTYNNIV